MIKTMSEDVRTFSTIGKLILRTLFLVTICAPPLPPGWLALAGGSWLKKVVPLSAVIDFALEKH